MTIYEMFTKRPKNYRNYLVYSVILIGLIIYAMSGIDYKGITQKGMDVASGIVYGILHPDKNLLFSMASDGVFMLMLETLAIATLGTIIGALLAIPVAFLSSENVVGKNVAFIARTFVLFIRTIPSLVWALMWVRVTGPGASCGIMTQSIVSIGMLSKLFTTAIEDLDTGILESLDAAGCNTFEKIRVGILPQLTAGFISTIIYRFDINIKDASTLGIVGAGGIGAPLIQSINSRRYSMVGAFLFGMIFLVMIIEYFSTKIRKRLATGE
ncbi:MAG: phosphonate ABC transporter, permease protein PhnE [Anaerorhabdus sp.]